MSCNEWLRMPNRAWRACGAGLRTHVRALRVSMIRAPCLSDCRDARQFDAYRKENEQGEPRLSALALRVGVQTERSSSNLVDPASSHMLVSKVKPCMS